MLTIQTGAEVCLSVYQYHQDLGDEDILAPQALSGLVAAESSILVFQLS